MSSSTPFSIRKVISDITTDWRQLFLNSLDKYEDAIDNQINKDLVDDEVYPPPELIFNAFNYFNISDTKVVIIGQDPYINKGEAMGLSFSVPNECKMPPSLRNVFKELKAEYGKDRTDKDLSDWVEQGVLLFNCALTVKRKESLSHMRVWREYTKNIIEYITSSLRGVVYIHWGDFAKKMSPLVDTKTNLLLEWSHPSPLCRKSFVGNNHFKNANEYLEKVGKTGINWI